MVRRAAFWSFSSQIASFFVQFATSVVVARLLSPREMGVYVIALAVIGVLQLFASFNVGVYVIREIDLSTTTLDSAYTLNTIISVGLSILVFVSSFFSGNLLREGMVTAVLQILSLLPIIGIVGFRPSTMMQRNLQFAGVSLWGFAGVLVTSLVTVAAAYLGASSVSPAYGSVAGAVVSNMGICIIGREYVTFRMSVQAWRPIAAFGFRMMSIGGISSAATRATDIILGHFLGLAALGLYSRANSLSTMLYYNVYGSATRIVFAKLSEAQRDLDRVSEVYCAGFRLISAVMGPIYLGLAVLSGPIIHILYGDQWLGAVLPFSLLMITQFIWLSFAMNWELFVIRDQLKVYTSLEISRSAFALIGSTIGSLFGIVCVAASSIVSAIFSFFIYNPHVSRLARTPRSTFYGLYAEATILSLVAAAPSVALMVLMSWNPRTSPSLIFAAVFLGVVLWAAVIKLTAHPILAEYQRLNQRLRQGFV